MVKFKWFWMTFVCWCLLGVVGAWALIYSPFSFSSKKVAEFKAEINGETAESQILVSSASLGSSLDALNEKWRNEGWNRVSENLNLASVLLDMPKKYTGVLDSIVQVQMFQNKDSCRLLGLWNDFNDNQTYEWVTDVPQKAIKSPKPSEVDFPLKPPAGAINVLTVKSRKTEICSWSLASPKESPTQFTNIFALEGFSSRLWSTQPGEWVYILQRSSTKLLAVVQMEGEKKSISLVKLDKI